MNSAKAHLQAALQHMPSHVNALVSLAALVFQSEGDAEGAAALFERALEEEPDNVYALSNFAVLLDR